MEYLVDAHALIWSQDSPERLGGAAIDAMTNQSHGLLIGKGTIWELGIKVSTGKLVLSKPFDEWIDVSIRDLELRVMEIELAHIARIVSLPYPGKHCDPFDRVLAVQSLMLNIPTISTDPLLDAYGVKRIWD